FVARRLQPHGGDAPSSRLATGQIGRNERHCIYASDHLAPGEGPGTINEKGASPGGAAEISRRSGPRGFFRPSLGLDGFERETHGSRRGRLSCASPRLRRWTVSPPIRNARK